MYTSCTQATEIQPTSVLNCMTESTTLYIRHLSKCPHKSERNYRRCGCPVWFQRNRKRWSAGTTDWSEALRKATAIENGEKAVAPSAITVEAAVDLYLKKRSGCQDASKAPYKDRWLLRDGSKRQQSLIAWAKEHNFIKLRSITAGALDQWRDTWVFRPNSFSQKVHCGVIAAFFEWAVTFEYLSRNPFDKLDKIRVKEVPTLPAAGARAGHGSVGSHRRLRQTLGNDGCVGSADALVWFGNPGRQLSTARCTWCRQSFANLQEENRRVREREIANVRC